MQLFGPSRDGGVEQAPLVKDDGRLGPRRGGRDARPFGSAQGRLTAAGTAALRRSLLVPYNALEVGQWCFYTALVFGFRRGSATVVSGRTLGRWRFAICACVQALNERS
jgi:hypothetical protein